MGKTKYGDSEPVAQNDDSKKMRQKTIAGILFSTCRMTTVKLLPVFSNDSLISGW